MQPPPQSCHHEERQSKLNPTSVYTNTNIHRTLCVSRDSEPAGNSHNSPNSQSEVRQTPHRTFGRVGIRHFVVDPPHIGIPALPLTAVVALSNVPFTMVFLSDRF